MRKQKNNNYVQGASHLCGSLLRKKEESESGRKGGSERQRDGGKDGSWIGREIKKERRRDRRMQ